MLNDAVGDAIELDGVLYAATRMGAAGHAVYGPYEEVEPGRYVLLFNLAIREDLGAAPATLYALIDVATQAGTIILAERTIHASDLSTTPSEFSLLFEVATKSILEFRVAVNGTVRLLVSAARVGRLGEDGTLHHWENACRATSDPVELHRQVRKVMRWLKPHSVVGFQKKRFGRDGDGGYVCVDDFAGIDTAFSFGINDDISWDRDVADLGLTVFQFDHTVDDPAPHDDRFVFEKKMIVGLPSQHGETLESLVERHDKGRDKPNIFLKMDIESGEWPVFGETSQNALKRIAQITCEIHGFNFMDDLGWRQSIYRGLSRLSEHFALVHVHANNYAGFHNIANVIVPGVMEATFVNRGVYALTDTNELFPGPLDQPCDPARADMYLANFRF